ncbi:hypothetical protein R5R35_011386 [Gryllus longicercus]|uniref:Hyaluronan-mediated motility receptor C-terminal domain-containing protein n=1 Tax=Gryllus longicercus TaxID=2509291 RepID=A0AAN9Z9F9_9ORTH
MSFPRARIQRFNEAPSCSPAPGTYDPKLDTKVKGPTMRKDARLTSEGDLSSKIPVATVAGFRTPQVPRKAMKILGKSQGKERSESSSAMDDLLKVKDTGHDFSELESVKQRLKETVDELNKSKNLCELLNGDISMKMHQIEELQHKNESLAVEIEVLQNKLEEAQAKHHESLTKCETLDRETLAHLEEMHLMVNELVEKKDISTKEMNNLREEIDNLTCLKNDFELKVTQKQQMILMLQGELSSAEVELMECRSECERQTAAACERAEEVKTLKATISHLEQQMEETDKQLRHMRDNLMNGSVVRENLEEQLTEKETACADLEANYNKLLSECEFLKAEHSKEIDNILGSCNKQLSNMVNDIEAASELVITHTSSMQAICNEKLQALEDKVAHTVAKAQEVWQNEIVHLKGELQTAANQLKVEQLSAQEKIESIIRDMETRDRESRKRIKEVESEARIITEKLLRAEEELRRLSDIRDELKISDVENKITIVELQDKVDLLTVERNSSNTKLTEVVKECDLLKSQNKNLTVGNRNLSDSLEALRVRLLESESDVEEMTALKCALESEKRRLEQTLERLLSELEQQKANNAQIEAESLQQIEEVREHLLGKLELFKQKALSGSDEIEKYEEGKSMQIQNLKSQLEHFRRELEMVSNYVATTELENEKQAQQLHVLHEEHQKMKDSFEMLTTKYEQQAAELKQRISELSVACENITSQEQQILRYKCHIEQLSADVENSEARIIELNEALSVMEESNAEHEREIEALTEKLDHQRDCAKVATQQIANLEATKSYQDHHVQTLTSELERHKEFYHQATEHMLTLADSNAEKEKKIEVLNEENEELKSSCKKFTEQLDNLKTQLFKEQSKLKESAEEIKLLEGDRFVKEEQLKELAAELKCQKEYVHTLSQQVTVLEEQKLETEEQLSSVKQKMIALEEERSSSIETCSQLQNSVAKMVELNEDLTNKFSSIQEKLTEKEKLCAKNESQMQTLCAEITNLNLQMQRKDKTLQDAVEKLKKENDELETHNLKLNRYEQESTEWKRKYEEIESLIGPFKEQLETYRAECKILEAEKGEVQQNMRELSLQYAASLGHQNQKQKIHYMVKLKEQNMELKETVRNLKKTIEKLRKDGTNASSKASNVTHTAIVNKGKENIGHGHSPVHKMVPIQSPGEGQKSSRKLVPIQSPGENHRAGFTLTPIPSPANSPNPKPLGERSTHTNVI